MYYEEKWIDGKLFWRGTPTGEWQEADAAKLHRMLNEAQRELKVLRTLAACAVARFDELEREMTEEAWRTPTERRALITRRQLSEVLNG